jgi:N-acylneuraminate cytidylyltransferase
MEILAIIPARGGSETIPHKNIVDFCGKPLIEWSIESAKNSSKITRIITSTDSDEIAEIAEKSGSEVPFIRPEKYSKNDTVDYPVYRHALDYLESVENYIPDLVVQLRPTTPVRPRHLIDKGIDLISNNNLADSLRCVTTPFQTPYKMWSISDDGYLLPLFDSGMHEQYNYPRQLLPSAYWQVGSLDIVRRSTIIKKESMTGDIILPFVIDNKFAVDIDDELSLDFAISVVEKYGMFPDEI